MIKECAIQFQKLTFYEIKLGIKKSHIHKKIVIDFYSSDFYHLAGLHKLTDIKIVGSKQRVFSKIISDDSLCQNIESSLKFKDIENRIILLKSLKNIFYGNFKIYPYKKNANKWSKISAEYIMKFNFNKKQCYLFLEKRNDKYHVCNSLIQDKREFCNYLKEYDIEYKKIKRKPSQCD